MRVLLAFGKRISDGDLTKEALRRMSDDEELLDRLLVVFVKPANQAADSLWFEALRILDDLPWADRLMLKAVRSEALHELAQRTLSCTTFNALLCVVANMAIHDSYRADLLARGYLAVALRAPVGADLQQTLRCAACLLLNTDQPVGDALPRLHALCKQALATDQPDESAAREACFLLSVLVRIDDSQTLEAVADLSEGVYGAFKAYENKSPEVRDAALEALSHMLAVCDEMTSLRLVRLGFLVDLTTILWTRMRTLQNPTVSADVVADNKGAVQAALYILVHWSRDLPKIQVGTWIEARPLAPVKKSTTFDGAPESDTVMPTLIDLLVQVGNTGAADLRRPAMYVLQQLMNSGTDTHVNAIVQCNVLPCLVDQLASTDVDAIANSLYAITRIVALLREDSPFLQQTHALLTATDFYERCQCLLSHENAAVVRFAECLVERADEEEEEKEYATA